jgi:hypothetical protein
LKGCLLCCLAFALLPASCNYDDAFKRYCKDNPQCPHPDAAVPPAAPEAGPGPELGLEAGPEAGTEAGPEAGTDANSPLYPKSCNSGCGSNEICNQETQVCMQLCDRGEECTNGNDQCQELDPRGSRTLKVCTCSGFNACTSVAANYVCNFHDHICEPSCGTDDDCKALQFQQPRKCDWMTGTCQPALPTCVTNTECTNPSQPRCEQNDGRCTGCQSPSDCSRFEGLGQCSPGGGCVKPRP